jgi:para-aminobenzoate synthetase/4-amino-4-deoxychorismate lyase
MNRWHSLPAGVYALVEQAPATVLLESAKQENGEQFSRLFLGPKRVCVAHNTEGIPALFAEIESVVAAGYFAAGYFSYECGSFFEPSVTQPLQPSRQPLAWFGIYEYCFSFDHHAGTFVDGDPLGLAEFHTLPSDPRAKFQLQSSLALTEQQYSERIVAIHELIRAGDIYQLNFTVPIKIQASGSKAALFAALRQRQTVAYGAFLHTEPEQLILSFSPELFFDLKDDGDTRRITTRPMKGTAPRGRTTREDREMAAWLANDEKNRAENLMIVDLLRNDLGRLCKFGSVRVDDLFTTERYQTLWQMTSAVSGELRPEVNYQQIFRALFPCGSITGAPKVRAMQLIGDLEEQTRGVTTGAIGFFSPQRTVFNVAIRTLTFDGDRGSMGVGSGIVIDSNPADEFRECLLKAEFLLKPYTNTKEAGQEKFSLIETMLWHNGYPLIELHLDRLEDSAAYFDFAFDRATIQAEPESLAGQFADTKPRRVRLSLENDGGLHLEHEALVQSAPSGRVYIATERTDRHDRMLFHKTTHRAVYAKAYKEATHTGFDDAIFLNSDSEVTEGAISNLFIEKDGRWFTPPVECGLLAGVYRRHLLETRPEIEEQVIYLEDLRHADAIYLANAVRGLRRVIIDWEFSDQSQAVYS